MSLDLIEDVSVSSVDGRKYLGNEGFDMCVDLMYQNSKTMFGNFKILCDLTVTYHSQKFT